MLVLLLHLALLLGLLHAVTTPLQPPSIQAREMILRLMPRLKSTPAKQAAPRAVASPQLRSPVVPLVPPPLATTPDLSGFGRSLFGCAPENLGNLSREERAHCDTGPMRPDGNAMAEPRSHVKDPSRRAAEMAAKNRPGHVPCTYVTASPSPSSSEPVFMVNPFCVMDGLVNGFEPLNGLPK